MKKKTVKIICITAGAIAAVGAGVTLIACSVSKSKKKNPVAKAVPLNDGWSCK